jgi:hypothetical protein
MGSVHRSRFSTRCPGRPACARRAWKWEERGDLSHHGWMQMMLASSRKKTISSILQDSTDLQKLERTYDGIMRFLDVTLGTTWTKISPDFSQILRTSLPIRQTTCHHGCRLGGSPDGLGAGLPTPTSAGLKVSRAGRIGRIGETRGRVGGGVGDPRRTGRRRPGRTRPGRSGRRASSGSPGPGLRRRPTPQSKVDGTRVNPSLQRFGGDGRDGPGPLGPWPGPIRRADPRPVFRSRSLPARHRFVPSARVACAGPVGSQRSGRARPVDSRSRAAGQEWDGRGP